MNEEMNAILETNEQAIAQPATSLSHTFQPNWTHHSSIFRTFMIVVTD
jgi:hypothetical protein